jgi:hypothetical protein
VDARNKKMGDPWTALQDYIGFNDGILVRETDMNNVGHRHVRLSVADDKQGLVVQTKPCVHVDLIFNGGTYRSLVSDADGIARFQEPIRFSCLHCVELVAADLIEKVSLL